MGKNLPEDYKSISNKMPEVKTSSNNEQEDKSEVWNKDEKEDSNYLYNPKTGRKVRKEYAYNKTKKGKEIKPEYEGFVRSDFAYGKLGSGKIAIKVADKIKDTIENGQERNAVKADYAFASPDVKKSLDANGGEGTKAAQEVVDKQVKSIKNGEGFEGSTKVLTNTEEGKKFTNGTSDEEIVEEKVEEEAPEIPTNLEDSLNMAENSESVINQLDKYGVPDPSSQGELEQAKAEAQNEMAETVNADTAKVADAKNKEEFDSILNQNKKEIEEATKVSGWFNVASVLEVLSLVACVFTGGAVPFIPFTRFGGIQSYVDNNAKLQARASAIQEQTNADTDQYKALKQEETKYKAALANEEASKQLEDRIRAEHPEYTDEQVKSEASRIFKQRTETSEDIQKAKIMSQINLDEKEYTTTDQAREIIRKLNQEKIQIDNAIKAIQTDNIEQAVKLYSNLIPTFGMLSNSTTNRNSGHEFAANVGGNAFFLNGNSGYNYNTGSGSSTTQSSREGVDKTDALMKAYKEDSAGIKKMMIADLEEAKREIDIQIAEYKQMINERKTSSDEDKKNVVSTGNTSDVGSPEGMKSSSNGGGLLKAAIGLISDKRRKHVYIPATKRSSKIKSDQLAKHTYIPANKRSTQEGIGSSEGIAVNWKKKDKEEENKEE